MELFFILIGLFVLVTFFMPWVNYSRFSDMRDDIDLLQEQVKNLESKLSPSKTESTIKETIKKEEKPVSKMVSGIVQIEQGDNQDKLSTKPVVNDSAAPQEPKTDWAQKAQNTFEQNMATKLPVWIGSISLIFAAFFLVKYSIELGWLGPMVRVSLGALFGVALLAAGHWIGRREYIANSTHIGQGLIGAGLVALYVSVYAAINLYGLLPPIIGFGSMTVITAFAVILSLRHGQPIAVFGLLGGLLTPALIGSDEPNAIAMFGYLFLLFSGMFAVLVRKGWWKLAIAALIGVFCWSAFWFLVVFSAADAMALVVFAMAITAVVLVITGKRIAEDTVSKVEALPIHSLNFTAIIGGVLTIIWLSFEMALTLFDWSMLGLLSIALMALAYFKPNIYQKPLLVKLGASLILFCIWSQDAPLGNAIAVIAGMSAIYIGGGAFIMRRVNDPRFWASIQAISAISLYLISYLTLDLPQSFMQNFSMFWGALGLALAAMAIYQVSDIHSKYNLDKSIREQLLATYVLIASAFISLGLAIELPWSYVPLAFAAQVFATAWVYKITQINFLKTIMIILTVVFAAMNYQQALLFVDLAVHALLGETSSLWRHQLSAPLIKLGAPSALIALALRVIIKTDKPDKKFINILFGVSITLALATAYYMIRDLFQSNHINIFTVSAGFIERGIITISCAGAGIGLLQLAKRYNLPSIKQWGGGLFFIAMLRFAYFDFFIHNPFWESDQFVGEMPIFNGITLTYGASSLFAAWAVYSNDISSKQSFYKALGFASIFAFVTFTVRQYFHGGYIAQGFADPAEMYSYSAAWLLTGLALLTIGIKKQNKSARMASLAFVILAVFKVFLFDAAELEGLYRVFSFLGLGISLIGLSYFYTKFVFSNKQIKEEA